jgi:hypothetical protein
MFINVTVLMLEKITVKQMRFNCPSIDTTVVIRAVLKSQHHGPQGQTTSSNPSHASALVQGNAIFIRDVSFHWERFCGLKTPQLIKNPKNQTLYNLS